jgi:type III secretory pathway component EscR
MASTMFMKMFYVYILLKEYYGLQISKANLTIGFVLVILHLFSLLSLIKLGETKY